MHTTHVFICINIYTGTYLSQFVSILLPDIFFYLGENVEFIGPVPHSSSLKTMDIQYCGIKKEREYFVSSQFRS